MLKGRELLARITDRLLNNDPFRELFFQNPELALAAYHLVQADLDFLCRIQDMKSLQAMNERLTKDTRKGSLIPSTDGGTELAPASSGDQQRIVNTGFSSDDAPQIPLPNQPLTLNMAYYFWLEVGKPITGSIELVPTSLPDDLPINARLQVVLFGFASEFTLTPEAEVGELQLMTDGSVKVVRDAFVPATLLGENDLLDRRLFFPVKTPVKSGTHQLRCNIYYQQNLIQSRLVTMHVAAAPADSQLALTSKLDYNLSHSLNGRQLQSMGENRLSILLNENRNGTHGLRFFGANNKDAANPTFKNDAILSESALQNLIVDARKALRKIAWGGDGEKYDGQAYRYQNGPPKEFHNDLVLLAKAGFRFYAGLIKELAGGRSNKEKLKEMMLTSGQVQIAAKQSSRLVVPAAFFYDYPLDANLAPSEYKICEGFTAALAADEPLETAVCFQGNCPSHDALDAVCPSGFWGFRHELGLPRHIANAPDAPVAMKVADKVEFTIGVCTDPAFKARKGHEDALQKLGVTWHHADTRDETLAIMKDTSPHVMYFYCHGGFSGSVPYIRVGNPKEERVITADNLDAYGIYWEERRPLVFINGCHTTALEPDSAIDFVTAFIEESAAAGVIGTEITIFEPIAVAFGEECLRRFLVEREPIGTAVRGARLHMLKQKNPLGLVYIPYVIPTLKLV
jgi:hypothetical protein